MGLPPKRSVMMLKRAMQAVPLVVDKDPVEVRPSPMGAGALFSCNSTP